MTDQKKEVLEQEVEEVVESKAVVAEDRSAFNCPTCKGSGLDGARVCADCDGTGKTSQKSVNFPEGTVVITAEGNFVVRDGQLVEGEAK